MICSQLTWIIPHSHSVAVLSSMYTKPANTVFIVFHTHHTHSVQLIYADIDVAASHHVEDAGIGEQEKL